MSLKLSIFPNCIAKPTNKQEKNSAAKYTSSPYEPQVVFLNNEHELADIVSNNAWSAGIFIGTRKASNFISTDFMVLDIDSGLTIIEAETRVERLGYCCLVLPTGSHKLEHNKFRMIFPLSYPITKSDVFKETWDYLFTLFPESDESCKDPCRFYYASDYLDQGFFQEGEFLKPVAPKPSLQKRGIHENIDVKGDIAETVKQIYGTERKRVPVAVDFFIRNAASSLPGNWITSLNSFVFCLALSGISEDNIVAICEQLAPSSLDKRDLRHINLAIRDGHKERSRTENKEEL